MSKGRIIQLVTDLIKEKRGYAFSHWTRSATNDFVNVYSSVYGSGDIIQINNAKNLGHALAAYAIYLEEQSERDYIVFLQHIIELQ